MKYTAAITIAALATSVSAANPWSDWSSSSSSSSTTSSAGCGPTTGVSTKCATWTVHDKATSKCETVTTTAVPSDCTWGDWESTTTTEKATTTSSAKNCGTTTSTSTGKVTYTKKEGEVVTKDITTVVTKTVDCTTTKDGEWDDAYITTTSSSDKCGPTTGVSTSTGCAKWTVTGKESSKCSTAYVTTTAVPSTCTTEDAAEETWGDWATADGYTTTVVTAITTYCAKPTTIVHAGKTYTVTGATTLTITDCPCTVSVPIYTKTSTSCSSAATDGAYDPSKSTVDAGNNGWGKSSVVDAGKASSTVDAGKGGAASYTKPAVATYTGGANALNMGAGLAGVGAIAAFFL